MSLRERKAVRTKRRDRLVSIARENDVGQPFGVPVAERQGYRRAPLFSSRKPISQTPARTAVYDAGRSERQKVTVPST